VQGTDSSATALGIAFVDIAVPDLGPEPLRFTFFWPGDNRWEGRNFEVAVVP
jgi:glucoamylase